MKHTTDNLDILRTSIDDIRAEVLLTLFADIEYSDPDGIYNRLDNINEILEEIEHILNEKDE